MKANYHTHTTRCQHADGEDESYVQSALTAGFDVLGFADHAPWPYRTPFISDIRMSMDDLPGYIASVKALQAKYAGQLSLHLGLESEYFPRYLDHTKRLKDLGIRHLILGQHYIGSDEDNPYVGFECQTAEGVRRYTDAVVEAIGTGLFAYVAHPDLFMRHRTLDEYDKVCEEATDAICQAAKEAHMPIEYNLLGLKCELSGYSRGYPSRPFWVQAKKWDNDVILGVDAHSPTHLTDTALWNEGKKQVLDMGFRLVDHLPMED